MISYAEEAIFPTQIVLGQPELKKILKAIKRPAKAHADHLAHLCSLVSSCVVRDKTWRSLGPLATQDSDQIGRRMIFFFFS